MSLHVLVEQKHTLSSQDGTTALCYAAMRGHSEIVRYLAEAKADVDLPDEVGYY